MAESTSARRRGRPPKTQQRDARAAIAAAAAAEFAEKGYDAATMRGIARRAEVDSALVHHYFDSKAGLFAEVIELPVRPDRIIRRALDVPDGRLGESIVTTVLTAWEGTQVKTIGVSVLRSAISGTAIGGLIRQFLLRELRGAVSGRLRESGIGAEEAEVRASLVLSQMAGVLILRHVLEIEPLASVPVAEVIARTTPAVQIHLDGPG